MTAITYIFTAKSADKKFWEHRYAEINNTDLEYYYKWVQPEQPKFTLGCITGQHLKNLIRGLLDDKGVA